MSSLAGLSPFSLGGYTEGIREAWPDVDVERMIARESSRCSTSSRKSCPEPASATSGDLAALPSGAVN